MLLVNNNEGENEFTESCGNLTEDDNTQPQILTDQSDPDILHNVDTTNIVLAPSKDKSELLIPKGKRKGTRKQNNTLSQAKVENSSR